MKSKENQIQSSMFQEMRDQHIFEKAQQYGLSYLDNVLHRNVYPTEQALSNLHHFEEDFPETSTDAAQVIDLLQTYGSPATVAQAGGRYFGFVCGGVVPAGLAAKSLGTFWDQNTAMGVLSPISAKLESVVERWLVQIFNLPEQTVAGFVGGTSMATFCGLAAARYRLLTRAGWDINEQGMFKAPGIRVVTSKQAHSTVVKAIGILGFGKANVEWIDVDDQGCLIPSALSKLDKQTIVILQAGNVNSGSFDPFEEVCKRANDAGAWVHVDGAFGMWAGAVKMLSQLTHGIEKADSWAVDGHKTLNTPYDCGIALCRDQEALTSALHMSGSYLVLEGERNGMFYTPDMSRRARIIELWATLKYLGRSGVEQMVYGLHERAVQFADELSCLSGFTILNEVVFNQVLVACKTDKITEQTLRRIQSLRECWVGGSVWKGTKVIRVSDCSWATTKEDISRSVQSFAQALSEMQSTSA